MSRNLQATTEIEIAKRYGPIFSLHAVIQFPTCGLRAHTQEQAVRQSQDQTMDAMVRNSRNSVPWAFSSPVVQLLAPASITWSSALRDSTVFQIRLGGQLQDCRSPYSADGITSRGVGWDGLYFAPLNRSTHANGPEYFSSNAQASLPNVSFHCL